MWDFVKNEMIVPSIAHNENYVLQLNCQYIGEFNGQKYESIKLPLMQFSGFTSDDGQDIYEGDFVSFRNTHTYEVKFENGAFVCYHTKLKDFDGTPLRWGLLSSAFESDMNFSVNVVGNIYQS